MKKITVDNSIYSLENVRRIDKYEVGNTIIIKYFNGDFEEIWLDNPFRRDTVFACISQILER